MATQIVSKFTTLDRFVAEVERVIEAADPTAEVVALDFRSPTIAQRDSRSAGTHQLTGRSDEGYTVRGAADINVYKRGTRTPHPREWELLNRYAKPRAIRYGLAYTFPKSPTVWLGSHSGPSLHLHADVSVWGTDYGDPYKPFVAGKGGYYRQAHAGKPVALPPPIKGGASASGSVSGTTKLAVDGLLGPSTIRRWQQVMGTPVDGVISRPSSLVRAVQKRLGVTTDGLLGPATIRALQRHLGTTQDGVISQPSQMVRALQARLNEGKF